MGDFILWATPTPLWSLLYTTIVVYDSHLKWSDHVKHISAKASRSFNYLRHTLFVSPSTVKAAAYNYLVRPLLEHAAPVWYLYSARDTAQLEAIQQRAAHWVCGSRQSPHTCNWSKSSTSCLHGLNYILIGRTLL